MFLFWRSGGHVMFKWHRVLCAGHEVEAKRAEIERMGYPTVIRTTPEYPEEFEPAGYRPVMFAEAMVAFAPRRPAAPTFMFG